jgi:hypothetical protein
VKTDGPDSISPADLAAIVLPPELCAFFPTWKNFQNPKASTFAFFSSASSRLELRRAYETNLSLLSFAPFESLKDSSTPAPLQSIHMHTKVLSALSFPVASTSKETQFFFPFSLRWRIWMPSWLSSTQATSC